ncbi:MAG: putative esterase [Gemmatimonadetes bacterium]|nr:putative esterase [Gemmatimonadota bacterium]
MLLAAAINRRRVSRAIEAEYAARFPSDGEGVAEGAQGFRLEGTSGRSLLLLHGSGDTPQSLRYLGERLHEAGYTVFAPLLPGHGRSPRAFAMATADDYYEAARQALTELQSSSKWVGLVGLSMGGAIAARLAASDSGVRALALLAPYLMPPVDVRLVRATAPFWGLTAPYLRGRGEASVHDRKADAESRAYGTFSPGALTALAVTAHEGLLALPAVTQPVLIVNSEQDNRIPRKLAQGALERVRAPMEQHWVSGCGHVITVDYCKDAVADLVVAFLARHAG